jgi:hypothetical protein
LRRLAPPRLVEESVQALDDHDPVSRLHGCRRWSRIADAVVESRERDGRRWGRQQRGTQSGHKG